MTYPLMIRHDNEDHFTLLAEIRGELVPAGTLNVIGVEAAFIQVNADALIGSELDEPFPIDLIADLTGPYPERPDVDDPRMRRAVQKQIERTEKE